ncbi:MAG TPA: DNA polymerase I [Turneriella sp.]|nr:DNA polymerase I [Turneriella sp.]
MSGTKTKPTKKQKETLVLVDGHALAYRAHFAFAGQNLTDENGNATETTFGFFRMLARLLIDRKPSHFVLCFDPGREENPRYEMFKDYKANRPPMPDALRRQIDDIQTIAHEAGFTPLIVSGAEADDTMASIVEAFYKKFDKIEIASGDKDLYNVLYNNVVMLRSKMGVTQMEEIDAAWVKKKLGIEREQVPDYMALVGDSADNIPGVKGVGEKTASKLMVDFKSLDALYKNLETIKPDSLKKKLTENREMAYLSQKLVTLRKDIPLELDKEDLELHLSPQGVQLFRDRKMPAVATEWEKVLNALWENSSNEIAGHPPQSIKSTVAAQFCTDFSILKSAADIDAFVKNLAQVKQICIDTETTGLEIHDSNIFGISIAWHDKKKMKSVYIPLKDGDAASALNADYADVDSSAVLLEAIRPLLENGKITKVGQNIKFDIQVFRKAGIEVASYSDDTMLLSYLLNPNVRRHNMDDMAADHLQYKTMTFTNLVGKGKGALPIGAVPLDKLAFYAAEDAEVTLALKETVLPKVEAFGLTKVYHEIDVPMAKVIADIEYDGVCIDVPFLNNLAREYKKEIAAAEKKIFKLAGGEFNVASTKQLQEILFDKLEITPLRKTDKGAKSTDQSVLEELKDKHPIIEPILTYRFYTKLLSTYAEALPKYVSKSTGRVHTSLSQVTAATGRLSSLDPNLQNIPIKGDEGAKLRTAFIAAKGKKLLSLDYSQIELRILAHYSGDKNLIAAYAHDADIHDRATYMLFRSRFDFSNNVFAEHPKSDESGVVFEVNEKELAQMKRAPHFADFRSQAKVLNFSIVYGVTEFGLSRNLGISRAEAKELIENYFTAFPGIKKYMESAVEDARKTGYAENLFGRRRFIGDLTNVNRFVREGAERLAINTPIQGTAADLIKKAMIVIREKIHREKLASRMVLQIHDELLFEVEKGEENALEALAREAMENVAKLKVPLKASGALGDNWNECKG